MLTFSSKALVLPVLLALSGGAFADERQAILIANRAYERLSDVAEASAALGLSQDLRRAGFEVSAFSNLDTRGMRRVLGTIGEVLEKGEDILVLVSGQISTGDGGNWLLATDADTPSDLMPGDAALSLDALAAALGNSGANSVMMIGKPLADGFDAPQGVTVFNGPTASLVALIRNGLLVEGRSLADIADNAGRGVTASGYLPDTRAFLMAEGQGGALPEGITEADIEAFLFAKAKGANTEAALLGFLERFPNGINAAEARNMLAQLAKSPTDLAQEAETALSLSRNQRRDIQSNLTMLGFDTNGVDGILGRGSRNAIRRWQVANDLAGTGYLTGDQIASIEAQAFAARQAQEREDAAFWRTTGRGGTAAGYHAYLDRYPQGLFSDLARQELARLQAESEAQDWANARTANTPEAYEAFLTDYPEGVYAEEACARLAALLPAGPTEAEIAAAKAQETKAMANPIFRLLAEQRLGALGYGPGLVDGSFDETTRQAIMSYQKANDLLATGYLDVASLNRLLNN